MRFIKDRSGRKRRVVMSYCEYRRMRDELEDAQVSNLILLDKLEQLKTFQPLRTEIGRPQLN